MSRELERMQRQTRQKLSTAKDALDNVSSYINHGLNMMADEEKRVAEISHNAPALIDEVDRQFSEKTKLTYTDIKLLFLAIAIQCARQYLLTNDSFRLGDQGSLPSNQRGDKLMSSLLSANPLIPPTKAEILTGSVPYDAIKTGAHVSGTGLSGTTHRYRTLGHDPILGWIFGTANILTNSLTKYDFETFQVKNMTIIRHYPLGTLGMLQNATDYVSKDSSLLITAVGRQAIHFGSDYFTKQGLPVPLIATVNNDLAKAMTGGSIDLWSGTRGGALSGLINALIACIHRLFYREEIDGSQSLYEVRTRKILSYSNAIATTSNVVITAFSGDLKRLDVGGMLVTLHRLISDQKFIHDIKRDFLKNEICKMVVGDQYNFMEGK